MQNMAQGKRSTLEELNQQFLKMQEELENKEEQSASRAVRKTSSASRYQTVMLVRIAVIVFVVLTIGIVFLWSQLSDKKEKREATKTGAKPSEDYAKFLTEEEKERWEEGTGEEDELFVEVNTEIPVSSSSMEAILHLINPPYSKHDFEIEMYISGEPDQVLYRSDRIVPGTVVEQVTLLETLENDTYPVSICYTFYKGEKTIGLHVVAAELLVEDKK
jgi:hypothetical protein